MTGDHNKDSDCTVVDGSCTGCGTYHGDPCDVCGGAGFHKDGCPESDATETPPPPPVRSVTEQMRDRAMDRVHALALEEDQARHTVNVERGLLKRSADLEARFNQQNIPHRPGRTCSFGDALRDSTADYASIERAVLENLKDGEK